jgi:hypothetical protein
MQKAECSVEGFVLYPLCFALLALLHLLLEGDDDKLCRA